jgi:hypothetical protein
MRKTSQCSLLSQSRPITDHAICRYGAVVRGSNAYVPPGARRQGLHAATSSVPKAEIPKVSVNAPDGAVVPQARAPSPSSSSKAPSPAPTNANKVDLSLVTSHFLLIILNLASCGPLTGVPRFCHKRKTKAQTKETGSGEE